MINGMKKENIYKESDSVGKIIFWKKKGRRKKIY